MTKDSAVSSYVPCFKTLLAASILWWIVGMVQAQQLTKDARHSGTQYLSPQLQALQLDSSKHPGALWIERGQQLWQAQCLSCHGAMQTVAAAVTAFPKLPPVARGAGKQLVNLEDFLTQHREQSLDAEAVLALSAALHDAAKGLRISTLAVEPHMSNGLRLWQTRMGRINLACVHCHDQKVGSQMRADVVTQAHPTGFPIYRMSWQSLGTLERRLRACYSGVQAPLPPLGSPDLRDLELFLKVRAAGMPLEGVAIRR